MKGFLITGGHVYDPATHGWSRRDIAVEGGKIVNAEVCRNSGSGEYTVIHGEGCIITTGLIDYHVHYFNHGTENGCNGDAASFPSGVTTAVDGGSCGAAGYEMYRKSGMAFSDVRILNMLLVGSGGQITDRYPEHLEKRYFDREKIRALFGRYPENLVSLKTRLSAGIIGEADARESLEATVELAEELGCNVNVHITDPAMDLEEMAAILRPGDVICHIYQGKGRETILDETGKVRTGIWKARERGVLFDASNGCNNFDLEICQKAIEQGLTPDIISSDINASGFYLQPLHSLPRILSKYLDFGMTLEEVLDRATIAPARLIGRKDLASLEAGTEADIAVFRLKKKEVLYLDRSGHRMTGTQVLVPQLTMKAGQVMYCQADFM